MSMIQPAFIGLLDPTLSGSRAADTLDQVRHGKAVAVDEIPVEPQADEAPSQLEPGVRFSPYDSIEL